MARPWKEQLSDETGGTFVLVGVCLVLFLSVTALAVDLGMVFDARTEAQRTADAAALAAASVFVPPSVHPAHAEDSARVRAQDYVARNPVSRGQVHPADVTLVFQPNIFRVRVSLTRRAIPMAFANIFGISEMDVGAAAVAEAAASGTAECIKPIIVPDWWVDTNGDRRWNPGEFYDPNITGWGTAYRNPGQPGHWYVRHQPDHYNDWGRVDTLKMGSTTQNMSPGWYFPFRMPGNSGGQDYRQALASACAVGTLSVGDWVHSEPGNMIGPTKQGIEDAIAADPDARWVPGVGIVGSRFGSGERSPRVATFPLFNPNQQIPSGTSAPVQVNNFGSFFIDRFENNNIIGRWLRVRAVPDNCLQKGTCRASMMYLRLVG